ncbi:MAG: YlxR family protein [Vampirovibrio sp.]|nr:YlxR family protein [Vampirovibrio sp.]
MAPNRLHDDTVDEPNRTLVRQCVACRQQYPRTQLLSITYSSLKQQFSVNQQPPLQGRSAYICPKPACFKAAFKSKKLQRSLKRPVPDDIVNILNRLLEGSACVETTES